MSRNRLDPDQERYHPVAIAMQPSMLKTVDELCRELCLSRSELIRGMIEKNDLYHKATLRRNKL